MPQYLLFPTINNENIKMHTIRKQTIQLTAVEINLGIRNLTIR